MKEILDEVLGELPLSQREILKLRFYEHFTLGDIASQFWSQLGLQRPVCRERIRQIEKNALVRAKRILLRKGIGNVSELIPVPTD